jgi:hypothetical protein
MLRAGLAAGIAALIAGFGAGGATAASFTCTQPAAATVAQDATKLFAARSQCTGAMLSGTKIDAMPQHGTLVHESGGFGDLRYTPDPGYTGPDSFTYHGYTYDFEGPQLVQQVTVGPNSAPTCSFGGPPVAVREGRPQTFDYLCQDPDGQPVTLEIVSAPSRGTLSPVVRNVLMFVTTYTVTSPGGDDSFAFRVTDGSAASPVYTQQIRALGAENTAPVCTGRALAVKPGETSGIPSWLCSDADGDPLTLSIVTPPAKGVTQVFAPPAPAGISYTANPGTSGTDSFTFTAGDGIATAAPATVTITIGDGTTPPGAGAPPPPPDAGAPPPPPGRGASPMPAAPRPAGLAPVAGLRLGTGAAAFLPKAAVDGAIPVAGRRVALVVLTCATRCVVDAAPRLLLSRTGRRARAAEALSLPVQRLTIAAGGLATVAVRLTRAQRRAVAGARSARVRLALGVQPEGEAKVRDGATLRLTVR